MSRSSTPSPAKAPGGPARGKALSREEKLALLKALKPREYPLSFAQQRLWFLDQLDPGSHVNTIFRALRLRGPLDLGALARAFDALVGRHGALRTTFPAAEDGPTQRVAPALRPSPGGAPRPLTGVLRTVDLSGLEEEGSELEKLARSLGARAARKPFDLARGPLFEPILLRLDPEPRPDGDRALPDHALLVRLHHIVADGWSMGVLFRELAALYRAGREGTAADLPELPLGFGDFARWQRERLSGDALRDELAFWRERLDGAPKVLELPGDRPRKPLASGAGGSVPVRLAPETAGRLRELARGEGATMFMALAALFHLLLFRHTGETDLVVGLPAANRGRPELEGLIGYFASTLLLRQRLDPAAGFRALLGAVREEALAVLDHGDLPFEKLVEELQPDRDLSRNPLFQVMLAVQEAAGAPFRLDGMEPAAPLAVERKLAKLELTLDVADTPGGVLGYFEYASEIFDRTTIVRLAEHWRRLAEAIVEHPDRPLAHLSMLSPGEAHALRTEYNPPAALPLSGAGAALPVHLAFARQAERQPDAPAVRLPWLAGEGDEAAVEISYRELHRRARRLAAHLRARGVGPEVRVGLCFERSAEMPAAVLAVLLAGGAYVPLDPAHPEDRLAYLIGDSKMRLLLTRERHVKTLRGAVMGAAAGGAADDLEILPLDGPERPWEDASEVDDADLADLVSGGAWNERTAYVIYTSGSTGEPKGVAVPHRAVANHARSIAAEYRLGPEDRVVQFASLSFDIAGEELYPTWSAGAALVLRPPGLFPSFAELEELFESEGVTAGNLPTRYWHEWAADLDREPRPLPSALRLVIIGTEAAAPEALGAWNRAVAEDVRRTPGKAPARLINAYGPTEATITATLAWMPIPEPLGAAETEEPSAAGLPASGRVSIGLPIAGAAAHLLGPHPVHRGLEPVPLGVPGELFLGGRGIARGYLDRPGASAERFVPDPFRTDLAATDRLYGTGDRCRRRADVGLEFLGRADQQVKIRGFRVEPGEVEARLAAHPAVGAAAVVARADGPGGARLAAYASPIEEEGAAALDPAELTAYLRGCLPEYMVPSALVVLPELPLTAGGKIDRRALPDPPREAEAVPGTAARGNPLEEVIAGLWSDVLQVEEGSVPLDRSFFELGGHSLLAARVISRLRAALGVELPLRAFFEAPTVTGLALEVERLRREEAGLPAPPVVRADRGGDLPASFSQQRLWFMDRLLPDNAVYNMPAALRLAGDVHPDLLEAAFAALVRRHEVLRTTLAPPAPDRAMEGPRQVIAPPPPLAGPDAFRLPRVDLSGLGPDAARRALGEGMVAESVIPFDLGEGPLLRAMLFLLPSTQGKEGRELVLHFTQHHAVTDGQSITRLQGELLFLYDALTARRRKGEALPERPEELLPPQAAQYADFAAWQRGWLRGEVLEAQLAYWKEQLAGAPAVLELPTDRPRPSVQSYRGARRYFHLADEDWRALEAVGRRRGGSLFMTLLALFNVLLSRHSGQSDVVVGWPIAGRHRPELADMLGYLANILVLRTRLHGRPTFAQLLGRVREASLGAYDHQDMPFEQLVEELAPERHLSHNPVFQVFFVLHHARSGGRELPGVDVSMISIDNHTTRADLSLALTRSDEELGGFFEYSTDLFDPATVDRFVEHFRQLLAHAAREPETPVAALALLSPAERRQLVVEENRTAEPYASGSRIEALFAERAAEHPDTPALLPFEAGEPVPERALTYGELDAQSNRLAHALRRNGLGPGGLAAVLMPRTPEMVIAVLAVLKAGGAYVPLDPEHPEERLDFVLADSGATVLVADPSLTYRVAVPPGVEVVEVEEELFDLEDEPATPVPSTASPDDLAYVIYTSGSTGRPKGVAVPHRGVVSFLATMGRNPGFAAGDTLLAVTTLSFDIAGLELYLPLTTGGRVALADAETAADPSLLARALEGLREEREGGRLTLQATPATWRGLLLSGWEGDPELRALTGGEALPPDLARELAGRVGDLTNVYGPTETTIWSARERIDPAELEAGGPVTIGRPIANTSLHLLDRELQPVARGTVGEVFLGGVGLARGYHRRPALTAAAFLPDPFAAEQGAEETAAETGAAPDAVRAGARLYRTGDLARRLPDGRVVYLRRRDHQVKVRGFRIELGEVEAALVDHPAVAEAVAVVSPDPAGVARLAAYFVPAEKASGGDLRGTLRAALRARLPEYMVPSLFVRLDELPLGPSGKVDRRALPSPDEESAGAERPYEAPRGEVEEKLAEVWKEVLGRERVGRDDHFFELGGHSLMATQVIARVEEIFGVELALRTLFDTPLLRDLAEVIVEGELAGAEDDLLAELLAAMEEES